MEEKDGVTVERFESVYIPLPAKFKGRCDVTIARGISGTWYASYSLQLDDWGCGYAPWPKFSKKHKTRDRAIVAGIQLAQAEITKRKKPKSKMAQQILKALDEVFERHAVAEVKIRPGFVFGWKYGGNGYQLYIRVYPEKMKPEEKPAGKAKCSWGVTSKIEEAFRFKTLDACLEFYRSRHAWPEDYEANIWNGKVQFFKVTDAGVHRVMPVEQPSLF